MVENGWAVPSMATRQIELQSAIHTPPSEEAVIPPKASAGSCRGSGYWVTTPSVVIRPTVLGLSVTNHIAPPGPLMMEVGMPWGTGNSVTTAGAAPTNAAGSSAATASTTIAVDPTRTLPSPVRS